MSIQKAFDIGEGKRDWHVKVTRNLNDWEIGQYETWLGSLESAVLSEDVDNNATESFTVRSFYRYLTKKEPIDKRLPYKQI